MTQIALRWPKVASNSPKLAPSWLKLAPSWPQVGPRCTQVGPRWPQVGPKLVQLGPKLPPSWHEIGHTLALDFINACIPKLHKNQCKTLIFHVSRVPFGPKLIQVMVNLAEIGRSQPQICPRCPQVAHKLAPDWPKLAPS